MRGTPGYEHLEVWCDVLTLNGALTEADAEDLHRAAVIADRESRRLIRVAQKTPATKARKRHGRYLKAARAKVQQIYCLQLADTLRSEDLDVVGDVSYYAAHMIRAMATTFGDSWLKRQEAW